MVFQADNGVGRFQDVLARTRYGRGGSFAQERVAGVRVVEVGEDPSDFKLKYDPDDPDANEDGYVMYPNVNMTEERVDLMAAANAYGRQLYRFTDRQNAGAQGA